MNSDNLNKFLSFIYLDEDQSLEEVEKELKNSGIDIARIEKAVSDLISSADQKEKLSWLQKNTQKLKDADNFFNSKISQVRKLPNIKEIIGNVRSGQLGADVAKQASAFFRNRNTNELSDDDIISFLEDCNLLDFLEEESNKK